MPNKVYEAIGCEECKNTGYEGRLCIYELVKFSDEIKAVISPNIEITELKEKTKGKFITFRENCAQKVISGETTLEEVLKVVY
jgi:general secretion pathway protein E